MDLDDLAKLVVFALIGIVVLVKKAVENRARDQGRRAREEGHEAHAAVSSPPPPPPPPPPVPSARLIVPQPVAREGPPPFSTAAPRPHPRPAPHPTPATTGVSLPSAQRKPLSDLAGARPKMSEHPGQAAATVPTPKPVVLRGRALLLARELSPRDRLRSGILWREILEPRAGVGFPRADDAL